MQKPNIFKGTDYILIISIEMHFDDEKVDKYYQEIIKAVKQSKQKTKPPQPQPMKSLVILLIFP
jgi:ribosomal protein S10